MTDRISVMIADDSAAYRSGLRALIQATPDLELAGEAADGSATLELVAALQPDVVLMDLNMPGLNGVDATAQIMTTAPHVAVLVVTMFDDDDSIFAAMQAGARGYVLKGASKGEMLRAIRAVAGGEAIFGAAIARRLQAYFNRPGRPEAMPEAFPDLSTREREVLDLIAQHLTNPEIADRLSLSEKTVRNYVSNIFSKLQVNDRSRAIMLARDAGYGRDERHPGSRRTS
jgi:DNA-binding NarL/FixJ family response regulator